MAGYANRRSMMEGHIAWQSKPSIVGYWRRISHYWNKVAREVGEEILFRM